MFIKTISHIASIISLSLAAPAMAEEKPVVLDSDVKLVRIVDQGGNGHKELLKAEGVVPGDTLVFLTNYKNRGAANVTNFVVINPVPKNVRITDEYASSLDVSVDGGKIWGALRDLSLVGDDGNPRPATAEDITHIRWSIDLLTPGEAGQSAYDATVR